MRATLLLNADDRVTQWQREALKMACNAGLEVALVAHCVNTPPRDVALRHLPYYALAWFSRNSLASVAEGTVSDLLPAGVPRIKFDALHEGAWQRIPDITSERFSATDVVIKFGMTLLRDPDSLPVTHGVLSYHHGDPENYRGRPASFYEVLHGEHTQGIIVQRLSDTLDGGIVLAQATSKVVPHSFRKTLDGAYRSGIPLLSKAVSVLAQGSDLEASPPSLGPNYRLPRPSVVGKCLLLQSKRKAQHLAYGALVEKQWYVGFVSEDLNPEKEVLLSAAQATTIQAPNGYSFAADPHWIPGGGVLCELMSSASGEGHICKWSSGEWDTKYLNLPGHASYPQVVMDGTARYVFPEVASFSSPLLWRLGEDGRPMKEPVALSGLEEERLVDGTLYQHGDVWYLFAGRSQSGGMQLELWTAPTLYGPYATHPSSPICTDCRGARMGGPITAVGGRLYRIGQDGSEKYGGRVRIHHILEMTPMVYKESATGQVGIQGAWGPHTITVTPQGLLIDFYREHITPLAGYRRAAALVRKRTRQVLSRFPHSK